MPTYVCTVAAGRLTSAQKTEIARSITTIHNEETGAGRYFVQVLFVEIEPGNHYVADGPAPAEHVWVRGDMRSGRTAEQKNRMLHRIMHDVGKISGISEDSVWVYLCELSFQSIAEYGRVLVPPGQEDAWFASLSEAMQERLKTLA